MCSLNAVVFLFTVSSFIVVVYTQDEDQQESKLVCLNEDPYVLNVPKLLNISLGGEIKVVHSNIDKNTEIKQSCNGIEAADLESFHKNMENYKNTMVEEFKHTFEMINATISVDVKNILKVNHGNVSSEMDSIKKEISALRENIENLKEKIEDVQNTIVEEFKHTFEMINATISVENEDVKSILKENRVIKKEISMLRDVQIEDKRNMENLKEKMEDVHDILKEIKDTVKEIRKNVSSERTDIKKEVSGLNVLGDVHQRIMEEYKETIVKAVEEPIKDFRRRMSSELANITSTSMFPGSCKELYTKGKKVTGVYKIQPKSMNSSFDVLCDMDTRGGGWTVIQNRFDGRQDFDLSWQEYKVGFGNISREFWIGLEKIYQMTRNEKNELLVEIVYPKGQQYYARYTEFGIGPETARYTLITIQGFEGDAGDSLQNVGKMFSTKDSDRSHENIQDYRGGWWLRPGTSSNLNGLYLQAGSYDSTGTFWYGANSYNALANTRMLIRPL